MLYVRLQGIRAVKLYSWEDAYGEIVGKAREDELKAIRDYAYMAAINSTIMNSECLRQPAKIPFFVSL